jgi:hypothetical protein
MPESLEKRRQKLAGLRDKDGHPLDGRRLAHEKFLSSPNTSGTTLEKSRMDVDDRRAKRVELAQSCEKLAQLMAEVRERWPSSLSKAATKDSLNSETQLRESARQLRERR